MKTIKRIALLLASAAMLLAASSHAQVSKTVTWAGGNNYKSWLGATNWTPQIVPLNNPGTNFTVSVPANSSLAYDGPAGVIKDLSLSSGSTLRMATNADLAVQSVMQFLGTLDAGNSGCSFVARGAGASLGNDSRVLVGPNSTVSIAGTAFNWTYRTGPLTVFSTIGTNALLDLSSLGSFSVNNNYFDGYMTVLADSNGQVNLSNVTTITGARTDGYPLLFRVANGANINFARLRNVAGYTQFQIEVPAYTFPALETVANSHLDLRSGVTVTAPSLGSIFGASSRISIATGAVFNGNNVSSISDATIDLAPGATANLSSLRTLANSSLTLTSNRNWNVPPLSGLNDSRVTVQGGRYLAVAAPSYALTYRTGARTLLTADGVGSYFDLATVTNLSANSIYFDGQQTVLADNAGTIDFSGLLSVSGTRTDGDPLVFRQVRDGWLDLSSLQRVAGLVYFDIEGSNSFPALLTTAATSFELKPGSQLNLPRLASMSGSPTSLILPFASGLNATNLEALNDAVVTIAVGGTLNAPKLRSFSNSSLSLSPGENFNTGALTNLNDARIALVGSNVFQVGALAYDLTYRTGARTLFSASGADCLVNLSSVRRFSANSIYFDGQQTVLARDGAMIDLSNVSALVGARSDSYPLVMRAENGGSLRLGDVTATGLVIVQAAGTATTLDVLGLNLAAPVGVSLSSGATLKLERDFVFNNTTESQIDLSDGIVHLTGVGAQSLEVAGTELGILGTALGNFGIGQLIVGSSNRAAVVRLLDAVNNGNRSLGGEPEALYLGGNVFGTISGNALRILNGSRLILNGLNAYAFINGQMRSLRNLIPPGTNSVPFDGGFIANYGGPRITNMTPSVAVTPVASSADVAFDLPIQASSFTPADVSITGPGGAIPATGVSLVSGTTWRISFAAQSADGTYTVRVGPAVNELAATLLGMDQNQDGLSGDGTNDTFVGTFVIDGTAPAVVGAYALQNGNRVGLTFNEAVVPAFATNPANYSVNGAVPTQAALQATGNQVVLSISPLVGDTFTLAVNNAVDALGNVTNRSYSGTILAMQARDLGSPGSDPRDTGSTVPFAETDFNAVGGGSTIWGTSDACQFASEPRVGDFDLRAQIPRLDLPGNYAEGGIMVREALAANSAKLQAIMQLSSSGQRFYLGARTSAGANVTYPAGVVATDSWIRLQRQGSVFTGFRSTNGVDWVEYARLTNSLSVTGYVGMVTCSDDNTAGRAATAWYRNYSDFGPAILTQPQSQSVASGANVTFGVTARGLPTLAYQWQLNGVPLPGETNSLLQLLAVNTNRVGNYRVVVSNPYGSTTSQEATLAVDGIGSTESGFEADLKPAPLGDNAVTVSDWVKVGRLVAGLDVPLNSSEFTRGDCAPRTNAILGTLPLGDGRLSVADWTQAGRYAATVDPLTAAGGPTEPVGMGLNRGVLAGGHASKDGSVRTVRLIGTKAALGQTFFMPVELVALGGENALGFSVQFDPAQLTFQSVSLAEGAAGASLQVNASQAAGGSVGVVLAKSIGQGFTAGTASVVRVQFRATGTIGTNLVSFGDMPVWREIADVEAEVQPAAYLAGIVRVVLPGRLSPDVRFAGGDVELRLTGEPGERYRVEVSADLAQWSPVSTVTAGAGPVVVRDVAAGGTKQRFYRAVLVP